MASAATPPLCSALATSKPCAFHSSCSQSLGRPLSLFAAFVFRAPFVHVLGMGVTVTDSSMMHLIAAARNQGCDIRQIIRTKSRTSAKCAARGMMKSCFAAKQRDLPAFAMRHIKKTKTGAFFCLRELVSFDAKCALLMRDYVAVQLFACCLSFATSHGL